MIVRPWQDGGGSRVLVLFDNATASIVTASQVGALGGEKAGLYVWA